MSAERHLCRVYEAYLDKEKLPGGSADELVYDLHMVAQTPDVERQIKWLTRFCNIWNHWVYGDPRSYA